MSVRIAVAWIFLLSACADDKSINAPLPPPAKPLALPTASLAPDPSLFAFTADSTGWYPFAIETTADSLLFEVNPDTLDAVLALSGPDRPQASGCPAKPNDRLAWSAGDSLYVAACGPGRSQIVIKERVYELVLASYEVMVSTADTTSQQAPTEGAFSSFFDLIGTGGEVTPRVETTPEPEEERALPPELAADRAALVALYEATDGKNWANSAHWDSEAPLNSWHGVETDANGRVVTLVLHDNQLSGMIPPELAQLQNLQALNLNWNQLSGTIPPKLAQLQNLQKLILNNNQLSGTIPSELAQLQNLQRLALYDNQLSGTIPSELAQLQNLQRLDLLINQLSGTIPSELAQLQNLQALILSDNQLSGTIPPELAQLQNLQALILNWNQLSGTIPPELAQLQNLQWLYLSVNELSGCIPSSLQAVPNNDLDYLGLSYCE